MRAALADESTWRVANPVSSGRYTALKFWDTIVDKLSLAEKIFTQNIYNSMIKFSDIYSVRNVAFKKTITVNQSIHKSWLDSLKKISDSSDRGPFIDSEAKEKFFKEVGGVYSLAKKMTDNQIKKFENTINASSLVFVHSILDNSAYECCRITLILSEDKWQKKIRNKKITFDELDKKSIDVLKKEKLSEYFKQFEKESLLKKIDILFEMCTPPPEFDPIINYRYDRERLVNFDKLRHKIVHDQIPENILPKGDEELYYLQQTNFLFYSLINKKYNLKFNPEHLKYLHKGTV